MQKLKQIQFSVQQQSIAYSYCILGNLLSSAENFVGLQSEQYGHYNISKARTKEELKSEFAWELYCFQLSYKQLLLKYDFLEDYPYPKEAPKEKILSDIKRWSEKITDIKDIKLYDYMQKIINGKNVEIDFDKYFENNNNKFNPRYLRNIIPPLNYKLDDISNNAIERGRTGKNPKFYVGGNPFDDKIMYKLNYNPYEKKYW